MKVRVGGAEKFETCDVNCIKFDNKTIKMALLIRFQKAKMKILFENFVGFMIHSVKSAKRSYFSILHNEKYFNNLKIFHQYMIGQYFQV